VRTSGLLRHRPELTESLASVIDHLRARAGDKLRPALLGSTDVFLDRLADHIAEEEHRLFPALGMASDHAALHSAARRLVVGILKGDDVIDAARVLLVQLLQHIRREAAGSATAAPSASSAAG